MRYTLFSPATVLSIAAVAVLAAPPLLQAQRYLGSIQGEVTDTSGAKVPDAEVTVEDSGTHFKSTVKSNSSGVYTFAALNPGTYTVTIAASNFATQTRTGVLLSAGQSQQVDVQLGLTSAAETVEVSALSNSLLDTGSPNIATTLSQQEVSDLPNVGRNPYVLATLAVGVTNNGSGGYFQGKSSQFTNPFSGVAVQVGSNGSTGHNRLLLNGIPNDPAERFSGASYAGFVPSPEAVQEVKVQTSFFDAQIGHGNGTVTNTVVRSGTNKLHGAAYYVFQNTYLNANTYERVPNQNVAGSAGTRRVNDQLSQTGFVVDGPVVLPHLYNGSDKTFFMVAFERYASHSALTYNSLVPTAAQKAGDFSALCTGGFNAAGLCNSGTQIYDPLSPVDAAGNRTTYFANNLIPATRINAAGRNILNYFPNPNANVSSTVNYVSNQNSTPSTYPSFIARFDQAIDSRNKLNAVFFRSGLTQASSPQGFPQGIGPTGAGYSVYRNNRGGAIDDIHQFSDTLVLDSRLGIVFHPFGLVYPGNQNFDLGGLGITASNLPYQSFPGLTLSDTAGGATNVYAGLAAGAGGQVSTFGNGSLEEILTKSLGRHNLRIGFEGNLFRYNVQNPQSGLGAFTFDRYFTRRNYQNSGDVSGSPIASVLLGTFTTSPYNITPAYATQQLYMAPFVQDDWRANEKLTLNLGFRWDYESPLTERYNKQVRYFDTNANSPLQVTGLNLKGGLVFTDSNNRHAYPTDYNNFQPRLGLAYQATPTTVVRAGYGIIYFNTIERPYSPGFTQQSGAGNNYNTNTPLATLSNPYPNGVALPTGSSLGLATGIGTNIDFVDPTHTTPKSTQYTLNVQQQFFGDLVFQIGYVGQRVRQLEVDHDINVLPLQNISTGTNPVTNAANQAFLNAAVVNPLVGRLPAGSNSNLTGATIARNLLLRPFPQFGTVTERFSPIGQSNYDALQIQISKPMRNHFSLQGSFTWNKLTVRNSFLNNFGTTPTLTNVIDPGPSLIGNLFGTAELPRLLNRPAYQRLLLGGWKVNSVFRAQNGSLIAAPSNVDLIGDPNVAPRNFQRMFNTCYQNQAGTNVTTTSTNPACDATSPTPAFRQRYSYTLQNNDPYIRVRQRIYPLMDASLFKQFAIREGASFEIRGEFFNVLNRPNFAGPNTTIGNAAFGTVTLTQANDARIGQLTARVNF